MKICAHMRRRYLLKFLALTLISASAQTGANEDFFLQDFDYYGIEENDFERMQILPASLMETDTLFRAAEEQRDNSMNLTHRLFNNRWLLDDSKNLHSGSEALRRYLRLYYLEHWKVETSDANAKGRLYLPVIREQQPSQFTDISNYRLRISDDKFNLRFKYAFD